MDDKLEGPIGTSPLDVNMDEQLEAAINKQLYPEKANKSEGPPDETDEERQKREYEEWEETVIVPPEQKALDEANAKVSLWGVGQPVCR